MYVSKVQTFIKRGTDFFAVLFTMIQSKKKTIPVFHGILYSAVEFFVSCFAFFLSRNRKCNIWVRPISVHFSAHGPISHEIRLCNMTLCVGDNHGKVLSSIWKNGKAEGVPFGREDWLWVVCFWIHHWVIPSANGPPFLFFHILDLAIGIQEVRLPFLMLCLIKDLFLRVLTLGKTDKSIFRVVQVFLFLKS